MESNNYLLNFGSEDQRIYHIIRQGRIDKLLEICPNAESLVAKVKNCNKYGYDIIANIAMHDNIEMLDKILHTYFNEKSEQNNNLRCEFLLSHQVGSHPKDYHYFRQYDTPEAHKFISETIGEPIYTGTPNAQKMKLYKRLRDAYYEAMPLSNPHFPMDSTRLGIAPKGIAATEFSGYIGNPEEGNAALFQRYTETYPRIRLVNIPPNQDCSAPVRYPTFELKDIPFNPQKNDLATQVFNRIPFPDMWIFPEKGNERANYFTHIRNLGSTYHSIKINDPVAAASFKNFNQNGKFFTLENRKDALSRGNSNAGTDYLGYSCRDFICLRVDHLYDEDTILHELAHDTDKSGDFIKSDLYNFVSTAMAAHPEKSRNRQMSVNETRNFYPASQYTTESLARVAQSYPSKGHNDDPLLAATYEIFSIYGQAQLDKSTAIINRIKNCMRLRIPGNIGYTNFENAVKLRDIYFINQDLTRGVTDETITRFLDMPKTCSDEELRQSEKEFQSAYKKLQGGRYSIIGEQDISYMTVENALITCIKDEIRAIEKIKACPEAEKVVFDIDTLSRDNITDNTPLEIMVAHNFTSTCKTYSSIAKIRPLDKLEQQLQFSADHIQDNLDILKQDAAEGMPLDRSVFCEAVRNNTKAFIFAEAVAKHYFPNYESSAININDCIPQSNNPAIIGLSNPNTVTGKIKNLQANLRIINNPDPDTRLSAEVIERPYYDMAYHITNGEKKYHRYDKTRSKEDRAFDIEDMLDSLSEQTTAQKPIQIANMRTLQLIYRELYPEAKSLPRDLQMASLTPEALRRPSPHEPSPIAQNLQKYIKICRNKLENGNNIQTNDHQY